MINGYSISLGVWDLPSNSPSIVNGHPCCSTTSISNHILDSHVYYIKLKAMEDKHYKNVWKIPSSNKPAQNFEPSSMLEVSLKGLERGYGIMNTVHIAKDKCITV